MAKLFLQCALHSRLEDFTPGVKQWWLLEGTQERCYGSNMEYTEWQLPLSGVHSIIMEKLAQPSEGGLCTPTPLPLYLPSRRKLWTLWCTLQLRGRMHSPYFYSTPIFTLWDLLYGASVILFFLCKGLGFIIFESLTRSRDIHKVGRYMYRF